MELTRIERMRRKFLKAGTCLACNRPSGTLEKHHEHYDPDMTGYACHACHHGRHFYPQQFTLAWRLAFARIRRDLTPAQQQELAEKMWPCGAKDLRG